LLKSLASAHTNYLINYFKERPTYLYKIVSYLVTYQ